jgi:hypothetical protein
MNIEKTLIISDMLSDNPREIQDRLVGKISVDFKA